MATADSAGATAGDVELVTADGVRLAATLYEPAQPNGIAVQVNSASSVPRPYYRHFATWLAARGFTVLTYDYRGIGGSRDPDPKADDQSIYLSGTHDQTAAADYLLNRFPDRTLVLVAHSVGGQIAGLTARAGAWKAVFVMGAAHGYWKLWPGVRRKAQTLLNFHVFMPFLLLFMRRLPAWFSGFEMPRSYARELKRYCLSPHWLCDDQGRPMRPHNADIRAPLFFLSVEDDEVVPRVSLLDLDDYYPNAPRHHVHRTAADYGMETVGHFGFFRRSMVESAWQEVADWLQQQAHAAR